MQFTSQTMSQRWLCWAKVLSLHLVRFCELKTSTWSCPPAENKVKTTRLLPGKRERALQFTAYSNLQETWRYSSHVTSPSLGYTYDTACRHRLHPLKKWHNLRVFNGYALNGWGTGRKLYTRRLSDVNLCSVEQRGGDVVKTFRIMKVWRKQPQRH